MVDFRIPRTVEVIGPTRNHFIDGKTEVMREGPCMKPHGISPGSEGKVQGS